MAKMVLIFYPKMQILSRVINAEAEKYNSIPFPMCSVFWGNLEKLDTPKLWR